MSRFIAHLLFYRACYEYHNFFAQNVYSGKLYSSEYNTMDVIRTKK